MKRTILATLVTLAAVAGAPSLPASAAGPSDMQTRVDQVLVANPGSVQTGWNEITMAGGDPVLTLADADQASAGVTPATVVGGCTDGKFCAYDTAGYRGSKLTYSTCTSSQSVAGLSAVRSIANSRATGTVRAYNGTTLLATVAPGTGKNVTGKATNLTCS